MFWKINGAKMLAAYYSRGCDSRELFKGRKIARAENYKQHLNQYDVIYLNMQQFLIETPDRKVTEYLEQDVTEELNEEYGETLKGRRMGLAAALRKIYAETDRQFIILIDEWDCVMRERRDREALQRQYLDFMRNLLKDQSYVALAYVTGILPVKKYGEHSALNMFTEYSMTDQDVFEEYTGFTEGEVKDLCRQYDMDFEETGSWYDGYTFIKYQHIYNPKSVVESMRRRRYSNYWSSTEVYDALKTYIEMDFDGLRPDIVHMLGGGRVRINTGSFRNDMKNFEVKDDVLTLLVHLGYLGYHYEKKEVFIPNKEILEEFENAMSVSGWPEVMRVLRESGKLLEATINGDAGKVSEVLDKAHTEIASILTYNDENSMACAIGLAYYSARKDYVLIRELPSGKGVADIVFLPLPHTDRPALVVGLKYAKTASSAIRQIKDRQYVQTLERYTGQILLVGIIYNKEMENKPHSCVIERISKQVSKYKSK